MWYFTILEFKFLTSYLVRETSAVGFAMCFEVSAVFMESIVESLL